MHPKLDKKLIQLAYYTKEDFFGDLCLIGESGVRQETVTADTLAELYMLLIDDLEGIWSYKAPLDQEALKRKLLNRNDNPQQCS